MTVKEITIPSLNTLDSLPLVYAADLLQKNGVEVVIDTLNWAAFPHKQRCSAYVARSPRSLYIRFDVEGEDLLAANENDNTGICQDSCVEFFMKSPASQTYFNFEFNCIGACYASERFSRANSTFLSSDEMKRIRRFSSVGYRSFKAQSGVHQWTLTVEIPLDLMKLDGNRLPDYIMGNFYKCGDLTAHPHYLTWNPIETPRPDYHRPEFFGKLLFE